MNKFKNGISFYRILSGTVAVVPGLLVLKNNLALPPGFSQPLAGGLIEIFCCFIEIYAWLNKRSFIDIPIKKFNWISASSFVLFIIFLSAYGILLSITTINSFPWNKEMFIPLFVLKQVPYGSFQSFLTEFGPAALQKLLVTHFKAEVIATQAVIYAFFCATFSFLTLTFTSLWLKYEAMDRR